MVQKQACAIILSYPTDTSISVVLFAASFVLWLQSNCCQIGENSPLIYQCFIYLWCVELGHCSCGLFTGINHLLNVMLFMLRNNLLNFNHKLL